MSKPREHVFVVGHRNPDTDSVCSAMAYAALRRRQGLAAVEPARVGALNRQTEFVLSELNIESPRMLLDVYPRVRDVVDDQVVTIAGSAPLSKAMELFHRHSIRLLPVVDDAGCPKGVLYLKQITERFLVPRKEDEIRRVRTSALALCECLEGRALNLVDEASVEELNLFVGAMDSRTFSERLDSNNPRTMILVTGDREKVLRASVERGVRILVVTGNLPVSDEILALARENRVCLISTPFDTATGTWLSRLSTPVIEVAEKDAQSIGLKDRVEDLHLKMMHSKAPGVLVVSEEGTVVAVATKSNLLAPSPTKLILVDHNELSQAVPGADKVEILEVVDHHRLGNPPTDKPISFINRPLGSTCTVVATLYRQAGITPSKDEASLMMAGLLSDTVLLKSPTTTEVDREILPWLGELAGLDPMEFGKKMFSASSSLANAAPRDLLLTDFKEYETEHCKFGVGQAEVVDFSDFHRLKDELQAALQTIKEERGLDMAGFLVTDIVLETSLFLALGSKELPYLLDYPRVADNLFELKGVLSRKKQLAPHLLRVFK